MRIKITKHNEPNVSQLTRSIWVTHEGKAFVPTRLFKDGRWYLVELGDPANGYTGLGNGWDTVKDMFDNVSKQFEYLVAVSTATLSSPDVIKL